ncbi:hypothetical protein [Streptomyces goshikiensis]|uniref:hypothetical protein n=1 Tax=Streptomyces goshikiensis TaxID=1942 RepID=UPI0036BDD75F
MLVVPTLVFQSVGGGLLITPLPGGSKPPSPRAPNALGVAVIGAVFFNSFHPEADGRAGAAGHAFAMSSLTTCTIAVLAAVLVFPLPA